MLVPWAKLIDTSEMGMGSVPCNGAWQARANITHNTITTTCSFRTVDNTHTIEELSGEHASEHLAARAAIFRERLENSLTALLIITSD